MISERTKQVYSLVANLLLQSILIFLAWAVLMAMALGAYQLTSFTGRVIGLDSTAATILNTVVAGQFIISAVAITIWSTWDVLRLLFIAVKTNQATAGA